MSSWTALNIAYDGDWEMPDLWMSKIECENNSGNGFDLLLYIYASGDRGDEALERMKEIARDHGDPVELVSVSGSDTSGRFTLKRWDDGDVVDKWGSPSHPPDAEAFVGQPSHDATRDLVEEEIGRRPDFGGNYKGY